MAQGVGIMVAWWPPGPVLLLAGSFELGVCADIAFPC